MELMSGSKYVYLQQTLTENFIIQATYMYSKGAIRMNGCCLYAVCISLTLKVPNTTIAEFANTVDPDETAHNERSHLDLQCLPYSL